MMSECENREDIELSAAVALKLGHTVMTAESKEMGKGSIVYGDDSQSVRINTPDGWVSFSAFDWSVMGPVIGSSGIALINDKEIGKWVAIGDYCLSTANNIRKARHEAWSACPLRAAIKCFLEMNDEQV